MIRRALLAALHRIAILLAMLWASFPVFWLVSTSFKPYEEWTNYPPHWLPVAPTLQNYRIVFAPEAARRFAAADPGSLDYKISESAVHAFFNSAVVSIAATALSVLLGAMAAFAIGRLRAGGAGFAFQLLSVRMMPPIAAIVPLVVLFSTLRLTDTHLGLILAYTVFTLPFSVWMIRSFLDDIPPEIEEAARLHGMRPLEAYLRVTLPLMRSGLMATALFVFILNWSEFLLALTLGSGSVVTVTLQVANYVSASSGTLYGVQAAMGAISTVPVILLGFLIQKHLVRGMTFGAVKG